MDHAIDLHVVAILAGSTVLWGLFSRRLERWNITAPMAFLAFGLLVANPPLSLIDVTPASATLRGIAEITLALVLFSDASRVNLRELRRDAEVPSRLLLVALPITMAFGVGAAILVFRGAGVWVAAIIAVSVSPTDAALGAPIMEDARIPGRVRRILNVESGLNDGIATPVVTFLIAGAASEAHVAEASGPRLV
jgi:NhaP-type Na+/H+ or K+/H+ antiporter